MKTKIKFHKPGILTTLQDHGRLSLQDIGITKSGAASPSLMELGNALVKNKNIWSFEFVLSGPTIEILSNSISVSITGNVDFEIIRSGAKEVGQCFRSYILKEGDQDY
jgi:allophanate hydrolase subunit 2